MQLEDYFEFEKNERYERIRLKGTRIALEHLLEPYLKGVSAERVYQSYHHSLSLEQVYAALVYYLHNKAEVEGYLDRVRAADEAAYQEYLKQEPSPVAKRLRALAQQREAEKAQQP